HCVIAENGAILAESKRFRPGSELLLADLDLEHLRHDRIVTNSFNDCRRDLLGQSGPLAPRAESARGASGPLYRRVTFDLELSPRTPPLLRFVDAHPFVPQDP